MLLKFGLDVVLLANLPATGHTIIEKLEHHLSDSGNVGFACVLLTPDDIGHRKDSPADARPRARQNVILELGMVLARLGRARVAILTQHDIERPSDIDGLLYLPYKSSVNEVKTALFKELKAAGYQVDPGAL
ncbi:TIR domain-containing protein [Cellulomonas fimi]|uniref:TIR domain-containing protein n=1 Tax=Cellulomonas fimi TaxID=1708 RepID=UPI003C6BE65D